MINHLLDIKDTTTNKRECEEELDELKEKQHHYTNDVYQREEMLQEIV